MEDRPHRSSRDDAGLPRRDPWPVCERLGAVYPGQVPGEMGAGLGICPSQLGLWGVGGGGWAEQLRVWKHRVNRASRTLTGHGSLSMKTSHLSSDKYRKRERMTLPPPPIPQ